MKIALITGGSRGVGKSTAMHLAKRGAGVVVTYNTSPEGANDAVAEIKRAGGKAAALKLDVGRISTFTDFAGALSQILETEFGTKTFDFLVNNAGIAQRTLIKDLKEDQFDELVNIHFKGPVFLTQTLLPLMNDGGHIVNISSGLTRMTHEGTSAYAAVKGAMEVMTKYMAKEFGARKIRSNIVAPGALDTDFGGGRTDEVRKVLAAVSPLNRVAVADDIGGLIAAVLSDDFRWVDGQRIEASGGAVL
jgi:NAD(P)-dependent dehydrogenase (short-subunit alcohol dehydrogenase family)